MLIRGNASESGKCTAPIGLLNSLLPGAFKVAQLGS